MNYPELYERAVRKATQGCTPIGAINNRGVVDIAHLVYADALNEANKEIERLHASHLRQTQLNTEAITRTIALEKLLDQTVEVLEEERKRVTVWFEHATHFEEELGNLRARTLAVLEACPIPETVAGTTRWWEAKAKPLLDNLKALKKEGTDG